MRHEYQYPDPSVALAAIVQKFHINARWVFVDHEGLYKLELFCWYSGKSEQYINSIRLEKAQKFFEELGCSVTTKEPTDERYTRRCFATMTSDTYEYLLKFKLETFQNNLKEHDLEEVER